MAERVEKSDAEWRAELSEAEYTVLRQKGTEPANSGEYNKLHTKKGEGHFACRGCGAPLYSAEAKFNSGCGWPAFDMCYAGSVKTVVDNSYGMQRIEIMCNRCDGHLGHVFVGEDFINSRTSERHCVNSVSVRYVKGTDPQVAEETVAANK